MFQFLKSSKRISQIFLFLIGIIAIILSILTIRMFYGFLSFENLLLSYLTALGYIFSAILAWNLMRARLDKKMQEFYTLKSGVISEFIGKLNKLKNSISDLEYINIKDHLKELRVFFNSNIKRFGHYICDSFYPSEILKGFSKLTIISGEISQDYSELTGSIENYYKNTINDPTVKCNINNWGFFFRLHLIVKIGERLGFISCFKKYENYKKDDKYHEVYGNLKSKIDEFIKNFGFNQFDFKFIQKLIKVHEILNQMYEKYKSFLDENVINLKNPLQSVNLQSF